MTGVHTLKLSSKRVQYTLVLEKKITVIAGDSATGKSTLVKMVQKFIQTEGVIHMQLHSDVPVYVFPQLDAAQDLACIRGYTDSMILVDAMASYLHTPAFAEIVQASSCYFVLITRQALRLLPVEDTQLYVLQSQRRGAKVYHELGGVSHTRVQEAMLC